MDYDQPILSKKKIIIIVAVFFALFGAGCVAYFLSQGPGQDIPDTQEPQFDFAKEGSKIAGIQILMENGGMVQGQFDKVVTSLDEQLSELEPNATYFNYVEESLSITSSGKTSLPEVEIDDSTVTGNAEYEDDIPDEEYVRVADEELEEDGLENESVFDTVGFVMVSSLGTEYLVSVYTAGNLSTANVTVEKK